jgi:uncharacterized protein involved in outer membrane biogenesis
MRALRITSAILVVLAVTLFAGAWLLPPLLDWNRFRTVLADLASTRLGRTVVIKGPVTLTLLPQPVLTAADVSVAEEGNGVTIAADELRLRVALGPLLSGHVDAQELVLRGVDMRVPWPMPPDAFAIHTPPWLSALSARVEEGRLSIGDISFTGIDGTLSIGGWTGAYAAAGTASFSGQTWHFSARLTRPGQDGSAGLDLALDGLGNVQGTGATLSGQIAPDGTLGGRVSARGPDLSQLLPAPPVSFRADGRFSIAAGLAAADDLTVEIGGSPARGAVAVRVSPAARLDLALAASRLDLDAWLPVLLRGEPTRIPTGIDLSAEAAQFEGGTLRRLRGAFDLDATAVDVREARAVLPGEASLRLAGRITRSENGRPRFDGDAAFSAPSLRTTLTWLDTAGVAPFSALPDGVLRSADLTGHATVEGRTLAVANLQGALDGSHISGSASFRTGARFAVGAGLSVDRLDLDPWLPGSAPSLTDIPVHLGRFDADLRLDAKEASLDGVTIAPLSLDAAAEAGRLTLRKLDGEIEGVHGSAAGTLMEGGRIAEGRIDLQTPKTAPLFALLPESLTALGRSATGLGQAQANVQIVGSGAPEALTLKVTADVGDLRLEAAPVLDLVAQKWTAMATLRHPGAPRFLEELGLPDTTAWLGDGSLGLVAQLSGTSARIAADSFELAAGALRAEGALALEPGPVPRVTGRVSAETLPLPWPSPHAPDPLPIGLLHGWEGSVRLEAGRVLANISPVLEHAAATLALESGVLHVDGVTGRLGGGALTGSASLDAQANPPALQFAASLSGATVTGPIFDLPIDLTGGTLDATASLSASGHSLAALLATLDGGFRVAAHNGTISGVALAKAGGELADDAVRTALTGGSTEFDKLDVEGRVQRGIVQFGSASMEGKVGSASLSGSLDLPGAAVDLRLAAHPAVPDAPEIALQLTGPLDGLRRMPELAGLARWRTEHVAGQ